MDKWRKMMQVAATYIGTVVGAGFASGQEILQFFTVHGDMGTLAIVISTLLFIWLGSRIMEIARIQNCYSYQEFNQYLFGKKIGWIVNGIILVILFGTTGVMLSGTGSLFVEQLHFPYQAGVLITLVLCLLTIAKGMSGILWVNSLVVPIMLLFSLILVIQLLTGKGDIATISFSVEIDWISAPFLYISFNLAMAQAVLVPLGQEIKDSSILRFGGILGGLILGVMLLINHLTMLADYEQVKNYAIPIAQVISGLGKPMLLLYALVVFGEIFTTIIGNVFGLARQMESSFRIPPMLAASLILFGSFLLSQWGFRNLVAILYPLFGAIGLLFVLRIAIKKV